LKKWRALFHTQRIERLDSIARTIQSIEELPAEYTDELPPPVLRVHFPDFINRSYPYYQSEEDRTEELQTLSNTVKQHISKRILQRCFYHLMRLFAVAIQAKVKHAAGLRAKAVITEDR
jgi:hypothetical protein